MKLYIPEISDQILLTAPWTFNLYREWRNFEFQVACGLLDEETWNYRFQNGVDCDPVTLVVDTILGIDRIYIRKGAAKFSSVTFIIKNGQYKGKRFWAKLIDVNQIEFEIVTTSPNVKPKKMEWEVTYEGVERGCHGYVTNDGGRFRIIPIYNDNDNFTGWQLVDNGTSIAMNWDAGVLKRKVTNILRKEKKNAQ